MNIIHVIKMSIIQSETVAFDKTGYFNDCYIIMPKI
jgi:hypothetical protein